MVVGSEASTTGSVQNSLQQMLLAFSQIPKINWENVKDEDQDGDGLMILQIGLDYV